MKPADAGFFVVRQAWRVAPWRALFRYRWCWPD